jgi:peptide/nickel transport system substrate-binding protein
VTASWLGLSLLAAVLVPAGSARAPSVAKGGTTLRVAIYEDPGTIEPGTTTSQQAVQLMSATQLTLVAYREDWRPGTGRKIIPYGAAQMPTLSADGKTYTFRIRSGLQFSDGRPVTARSFKIGFERVLDPGMGGSGGGFDNVVGALAFIQGQADHVSGVRAPTKDRLVFKLAEVEPNFLARLTRPLVSAMPLGLPVRPGGIEAPLPSAGPYFVQEYFPRRTLRLVRNPYWKPSTLPSRPASIQTIDYLERATAKDAFAAVRNGDADVATVLDPTLLNPDLIRELEGRYGRNSRQFWVRATTRRYSLIFNTRHPPFDDARLRRAASFALDRTKLRDTLGPRAGQVTDQLLPPVSAGFRNWTLYPSRPNLRRAKRAARGALKGRKDATLIVSSTGSWPAVGDAIKSNLVRIGLHIEVVPKAPLVIRDYLRENPDAWDLATLHTSPYHVDPGAFINSGLQGHDLDGPGGAEGRAALYNYSGFDDPKWVRRMRRMNSRRHRLKAYALLDRDLMNGPAPIAPYATGNSLTLVSARIGCFRSSAYPGHFFPNLAALCLR